MIPSWRRACCEATHGQPTQQFTRLNYTHNGTIFADGVTFYLPTGNVNIPIRGRDLRPPWRGHDQEC